MTVSVNVTESSPELLTSRLRTPKTYPAFGVATPGLPSARPKLESINENVGGAGRVFQQAVGTRKMLRVFEDAVLVVVGAAVDVFGRTECLAGGDGGDFVAIARLRSKIGIAIAAMMEIIATTIINSIKVIPLLFISLPFTNKA